MVKSEWKSHSIQAEEKEAPGKYCGYLQSPTHLSSHPPIHPFVQSFIRYLSAYLCIIHIRLSTTPSHQLIHTFTHITRQSHIHLRIHPIIPPFPHLSLHYRCTHSPTFSAPHSLSIRPPPTQPSTDPLYPPAFPSSYLPPVYSPDHPLIHSSVPTNPLPRSALPWAWHMTKLPREDRLRICGPACGSSGLCEGGNSETI